MDKQEKPFIVKEPAECVGFDSQWKVKKVTVQDSVQTQPIQSEDASIATSETINAEIQTDQEEIKPPEYDEQRLADFLKRLYPKVSKELNEASSSHVFKNYHTSGTGTKTQSKLLKSLKLTPESGDFNKSVSCLSWNATGKKLAVSITQDHDTWCHHTGLVFIYSFLAEAEEKLLRIKTPNCITAVSYHPTMPPILAVGSYTGEIFLLNTQNDANDQLLLKTNAHDNLITQLAWVDDLNNENHYELATGSLDGCLNIWDFNMSQSDLKLREKYKIKTPLFGKLQRKGETSTDIAKKIDRGIVSFDFSKHSPEKFVVAAEGGLIALGSRLGARELPGSTPEIKVADPVFKYYRSHEGEITTLVLSPDRVDLFASNASDGEIRVYDVGEEEPGNVIITKGGTLGVVWVPYSQNLLAACGLGGHIEFYNARNGKIVGWGRGAENGEENKRDVCLTCLAFHKSKISVVAVGTKDGSIEIWDIPWNSF